MHPQTHISRWKTSRTGVLLTGIVLGFFLALALPNTYRVQSFTGTLTMQTENGATCVTPTSALRSWYFTHVNNLADNPDGTICATAPLALGTQSLPVGTSVRAGVAWLPSGNEARSKAFVFLYPH